MTLNNLGVDSMRTLFLVFTMFASGCATAPSPRASVVQDADQKLVANCQFAGSVSGTSGWGNMAASAGINNAKNQARDQAAQLNATHIVWLSVEGGYSPAVSGSAYICG